MSIYIHIMPPSTFYIFLGIFTVMSGFSVVSLNTQGCRDSFKRCFLLDFPMTKFNADIVFLQDIYTIPSEEDTWKLIWGGNILFSHLSSNTTGRAICLSNKLDHQILDHKMVIPGRVLHVTVCTQEQNYHLINVCTPTGPKGKLLFLRRLKHRLNKLHY